MEIFEYIDPLNRPYHIYMETMLYPVKAHWHYYAEIIYMSEGELEVETGTVKHLLKPGDLLFIYPKSIHSMAAVIRNMPVSADPQKEREERISVTEKYQTLGFEEVRSAFPESMSYEDYLHSGLDPDFVLPKYAVLKFDLNELNLSRVQAPWVRNIFLNTQFLEPVPNYFPAASIQGTVIHRLVMNCIRETTEQQFGYEINVSACLNSMLVNLIRVLKQRGIPLDQSQFDSEEDRSLNNIIEYIDNHSGEQLAVAELAKRCNMSYSNFARLFKKVYGRSCKEYIEFVRITKAHDMLIYTNFSLNYISSECGFYDCSHFIRTYKKIIGVTPKQQRSKAVHRE